MNTFSLLLISVLTVQSAPHHEFQLLENSKDAWEVKTKEQVDEIYESCATLTNTNSNVLKLLKAHILSNDSSELLYCVDRELGLLKNNHFFADLISKQMSTSLMNFRGDKIANCFQEANHLRSKADFIVYFHECMISYSLWRRPGGEQARENKQSCQVIHNITQYDICHGTDRLKIVKYSICDNLRSEVYQGNESIGFGYNFHRMALHTFAYLPPYEVYADFGKCMNQGRAYRSDELFAVMDCVNEIIPPKWRSKSKEEIMKSLAECRNTTDISEELYSLLKQKIVRHDSVDFLRCVGWQLGMETGGCYVSHRTVAQIKLLNPTIDEKDIQKMVDECYSEYLTTEENWSEYKYHQCILSMKGLGDAKALYLESLM